MKTLSRLILALAFFAVATFSARAASRESEVTPDDLLKDGYAFDIKADLLKDGNVLFRIRIFGANLDDTAEVRTGISLEVKKIREDGQSSIPLRTIVAERNEKFLSCIFLVPEKSLEDPDFCFVFSRVGVRVRSASSCFARLRSFYKAEAVVSGPDRLEVEKLKAGADSGYSTAQAILGYRYEHGEGVPRDLVLAYKWFILASASGDSFARSAGEAGQKEIAAKVTPAQIAEGERLAREFKPVVPPPAKAPVAAGEKAAGANQKN